MSEREVTRARLRRWLIWTWTVIVLAISIGTLPGFVDDNRGSVPVGLAWAFMPVAFTALGALIATRRPRNHLTWILMVVGFASLMIGVTEDYTQSAPTDPGLADYVAVFLSQFNWMGIIFPILLLLYLFPTGRFLTPLWRWAGWLAIFDVALLSILGALTTTVGTEEWTIENPIGVVDPAFFEGPFITLWSMSLIVLAIGGFASMVVRYRRSSLTVRTQIKWVLYSTSVFAVIYAISVPGELWLEGGWGILIPLSIILIPVSIAAAIVQYRLYDIDRLISRTASYGIVVALLGGVFVLLTWLPSVLIGGANEGGDPQSAPPVVVAGSTLAVAALFNPVRRRVRRAVDRRFNRTGYDVQDVTAELSARLSAVITVEQVGSTWVETVEQALEPTAAAVWVRDS